MKRIILLVLVTMLTISALAACGKPAVPAMASSSAVTPSASVTPQVSVAATPSVPDSVNGFWKDPQKYFAGTLETLPGMKDLIEKSGLISPGDSEEFTTFWFSSYYQPSDSDDPKDIIYIPHYDITVPADAADWDVDKVAGKVSSALGIEYKDVETTDSNGDSYIYKSAKGDASGYSDSKIYCNCEMVRPDTARIFFSYGTKEDAIHKLVDDSFSRGIVKIPDALKNYKQTYGITYWFNPYVGETDKKVGSVTESWWNVSAQDAQSIDKFIRDSGFTDTDPDDGIQEYYIKLNDNYFDGAMADIYNLGSDKDPYYVIDFSIYYKAQGN